MYRTILRSINFCICKLLNSNKYTSMSTVCPYHTSLVYTCHICRKVLYTRYIIHCNKSQLANSDKCSYSTFTRQIKRFEKDPDIRLKFGKVIVQLKLDWVVPDNARVNYMETVTSCLCGNITCIVTSIVETI
jgi:hypothetical protein